MSESICDTCGVNPGMEVTLEGEPIGVCVCYECYKSGRPWDMSKSSKNFDVKITAISTKSVFSLLDTQEPPHLHCPYCGGDDVYITVNGMFPDVNCPDCGLHISGRPVESK